MFYRHRELHKIENVGWLRATVLGANDGIVSTASLVLGVAASHATHESILVAGVAALASGAMSMATGEYVSVRSQADAEHAALQEERAELSDNPKSELQELAAIYVARGLDAALAKQVAAQLMAHDALDAHARDELGITAALSARPLQAACSSALSFSIGALLPLLVVALAPHDRLIMSVALASLVFLALLGGFAARAGGASVTRGVARVTFWSALAMGVTMGIGALFGVAA
jgi:VIT1/CCC1 family predicted Fe2+/Mn2+ transporter